MSDLVSDKEPTLSQTYDLFIHPTTLKETLYGWQGGNEWLFQKIHTLSDSIEYNTAMLAITNLGDHHHFKYYLAVMFVYLFGALLVRKVMGYAGVKQFLINWLGVVLVFIASYMLGGSMIGVIKDYTQMPRPYVVHQDVQGLDKKTIEVDDYRSFPSGHVAFICMVVFSLWPVLSPNFRWFGVSAIVAMAWSRVALGMHFPVDVVGSVLLILILVPLLYAVIFWCFRRILRLQC